MSQRMTVVGYQRGGRIMDGVYDTHDEFGNPDERISVTIKNDKIVQAYRETFDPGAKWEAQ